MFPALECWVISGSMCPKHKLGTSQCSRKGSSRASASQDGARIIDCNARHRAGVPCGALPCPAQPAFSVHQYRLCRHVPATSCATSRRTRHETMHETMHHHVMEKGMDMGMSMGMVVAVSSAEPCVSWCCLLCGMQDSTWNQPVETSGRSQTRQTHFLNSSHFLHEAHHVLLAWIACNDSDCGAV
jgi:hypothetical protein